MAQIYPLDIVRRIERRWQRRLELARADQDDGRAGGGPCPVCEGYASSAATPTEYCGKGVVRRHWQCCACGHGWVTALHVLA